MDPTPRLPHGAASPCGSDLAIGPTGADHEAARRLRGRSLLAARGAWLAVVALTLGLAIPGFVVAFDRPELLQQPELLGLADRLGLPNRVLMAAGLLVPMTAVSAIAIFLFWRRSDDWMAMLFSLQLITSIAFVTRSLSVLEHAYPAVRMPVQLIWLLGIVLSIVTLYLFPDGRFVPKSTRLLAIAAVVLVVLSPGLPEGMLTLPRAQEEMAPGTGRWRSWVCSTSGAVC
jgi:hypothetical protein